MSGERGGMRSSSFQSIYYVLYTVNCRVCRFAVCVKGDIKLPVTLHCPLSAASRDCDNTDTDDLLLQKKEKA